VEEYVDALASGELAIAAAGGLNFDYGVGAAALPEAGFGAAGRGPALAGAEAERGALSHAAGGAGSRSLAEAGGGADEDAEAEAEAEAEAGAEAEAEAEAGAEASPGGGRSGRRRPRWLVSFQESLKRGRRARAADAAAGGGFDAEEEGEAAGSPLGSLDASVASPQHSSRAPPQLFVNMLYRSGRSRGASAPPQAPTLLEAAAAVMRESEAASATGAGPEFLPEAAALASGDAAAEASAVARPLALGGTPSLDSLGSEMASAWGSASGAASVLESGGGGERADEGRSLGQLLPLRVCKYSNPVYNTE
jgi:hypothetical protein